MERWVCLLLTGIFLLTGCSFSPSALWKSQPPRFAVVDWDTLVKQHPRYSAWQKKQKQLETAKWLRDRQLENGRQQLDLLAQIRDVKDLTGVQFRQAQIAAKVAEKRTQEMDLLKKAREALDAQAEAQVAQDRAAMEDKYRIPLFNLRLKLSSVKLSQEAQSALLQELQELLDKRQQERAAIEARKQQWLDEKMATDVAASRARLEAFSKELAGQIVADRTKLTLFGTRPDQPAGSAELDKLIASMDKQIGQQENDEKKLRDAIDSDILSAIKKVNLDKRYTLVFKNPRANISADDITQEVNAVVQQIAE